MKGVFLAFDEVPYKAVSSAKDLTLYLTKGGSKQQIYLRLHLSVNSIVGNFPLDIS